MAGSKTALLLLDYQGLIVGMIQDEAVKAKLKADVNELIKAARETSTPIVHGLIGVDEPMQSRSKMLNRWETQFKPAMTANPGAMKEDPEFAPPADAASNEITVTRTPGIISAMKSHGLLEKLKEWGVDRVVIGGLSTSGCALSTAREAADLNFVTAVVREACWDPVQSSHENLLDNVFPMTCHVVDKAKGIELLRGGDI